MTKYLPKDQCSLRQKRPPGRPPAIERHRSASHCTRAFADDEPKHPIPRPFPKTPFRIRISPRRRHDKTETASPPQSNTTGKQPKKFRKTERSSPPLSRKFLSAHNDARLAPTKTGPRPSGRSPAANSPRRKVSHCRPQHPSYRATRW